MAVLLLSEEGKTYLVKDPSKDFHSQFGFVTVDDMKKSPGSEISTNTGKKLIVLAPGFNDYFKKITRGAQTVHTKDIGLIIAETGINKHSRVVDAGGGSGALSLRLAHIVKEVTTYEIREDFLKVVEKNIMFLGVDNMHIKLGSIYEPIDETELDVMTLDVPEPWKALKTAKKSVKVGGFVVSYSPCIPQVMDFVSALDDSFLFLKTVEVIERPWDVTKRKVRPKSAPVGHTGFLTFVRKVKNV